MATRISVGGWPGGRRLPRPDFAPVGCTSPRLLPSLSLPGCEKGDIVLGQACEIEPVDSAVPWYYRCTVLGTSLQRAGRFAAACCGAVAAPCWALRCSVLGASLHRAAALSLHRAGHC